MSNLSDIGFPVASEQDVNQVLMDALSAVSEMPCPPYGTYYRYRDPSGAELYLQGNADNELVGFNPAFGKGCGRRVELLGRFERDTSELDGAFVAKDPEGGGEFVFDCPDFRLHRISEFPFEIEVELTAFASNDLSVVPENGESGYQEALAEGIAMITRPDAPPGESAPPPQAHVRIKATVVTVEQSRNSLSGAEFVSIEADAGPGRIRIVADPGLIGSPLEGGEKLEGSFWLSGKLKTGQLQD